MSTKYQILLDFLRAVGYISEVGGPHLVVTALDGLRLTQGPRLIHSLLAEHRHLLAEDSIIDIPHVDTRDGYTSDPTWEVRGLFRSTIGGMVNDRIETYWERALANPLGDTGGYRDVDRVCLLILHEPLPLIA